MNHSSFTVNIIALFVPGTKLMIDRLLFYVRFQRLWRHFTHKSIGCEGVTVSSILGSKVLSLYQDTTEVTLDLIFAVASKGPPYLVASYEKQVKR